MSEPILCYVRDQWAYFTTQSLDEQWGDDWDDAPYEHNAGPPYEYRDHDAKQGKKPWGIAIVAWDGDFWAPESCVLNPDWSVEQINKGCVPWLSTALEPFIAITAGTPLSKFCELIRQGGGKVYLEAK